MGKFVEGVKKIFSLKKRKPTKEANGLPPEAGALPTNPVRLKLCRVAFEDALEKLATDTAFFHTILALKDTLNTGNIWKKLAPLTPAEKAAVVWRIREFARARKNSGQNS